jgi:hypothetical protein
MLSPIYRDSIRKGAVDGQQRGKDEIHVGKRGVKNMIEDGKKT